ncbi:YitT family protein [Nocardioides sambongensis]|uniref:YitT family protein n=1 Tax=Nocardioides sambongensis TaxID=2589074 RepID=UPI0011281E2E|nr:YitT family protein [Nocardioides sambongensis]
MRTTGRSATAVRAEESAPPAGPPHSLVDDAFAVACGTIVVSLGLFLLREAELVTGGTAGLALLVSYAVDVPFGVLFAVINLPFFVLALRRKGWRFTLRSLISVGLVSALSEVHPRMVDLSGVDPLYAAVVGNLIVGLGLLILFRHGSSVGGFNIVALIAQEQLGWRAGNVQMSLDLLVVLGALLVAGPVVVAFSALGAALLNLVLTLNHRPGRYLGI